ncbi:acyltransferase family protein [Acinetobacter shaoyimingii]|uniref:Acyltransferase n=1 Tax=Acinetobacter shaoyimingii TaxID=2715164 RepID=A0A6G8RRS3_9GAMM|nr:acyltransferase family protein [Acinetobacter shaoyimingii]QIO04604.1 acyltransferase [Acinetobacter shaoyimingii]
MGLSTLKNKPSNTQYFRPEIQGIRLLGALLVACFHIWGNGVSGGVDVFFVISGYFLGYSKLNRIRQSEKFSAHNHIQRFIQRTIPEVILVLLFCFITTIFILSPVSWKNNFSHIVASAIYLENYWLIIRSSDYLARNESVSLVQHFWAISIIAQVYVSWIIIVKLSKFGANLFKLNLTFCMVALLSILSLCSFCWGIYFTFTQPEAAYFDLFSRYWQFAVGAIAALATAKIAKSSTVLVSIGFALIVSCGFVVGSAFKFPGFAALWPVAGAILVLVFARGLQSNLITILSHPWIVKGGFLGFGVYLWHWPLYILYLRVTNKNPDILSGIIIICLSFILAWLSSKITLLFSIHSQNIQKKSQILVFGLFTIALCSLISEKTISKFPAFADKVMSHFYTSNIIPGPLSKSLNRPESSVLGCFIGKDEADIKTCIFNEDGKNGSIYLVGGSHADHWLPALQEIMQEKDFKIYTSTKGSCTFANTQERFLVERNFNESCIEWNNQVMADILKTKPNLVIAIGTRIFKNAETPSNFNAQSTTAVKTNSTIIEMIPPAYLSNFKILKNHGIEVLAIRDNPDMSRNIPDCVHQLNYQESDCIQLREDNLDDQAFIQQKKAVEDWLYIADPTPHYCDEKYCFAVKDNIMIYRDADHLTVEYAKTLAPWLDHQLKAVHFYQ